MSVFDQGVAERDELLVPNEVVDEVNEVTDFDGYVDVFNKVTRVIDGKLAEDVRKRVGAAPDAEVQVTEEEFDGWISDVTSTHTWTTIIECNGVKKEFEGISAAFNFSRLLQWLDEDAE